MKIVHLSTGHLGGAGLAARRLNLGLNAAGVDSRFAALENPGFLPQESEIAIPRRSSQKFYSGLTTFASKKLSQNSLVTPFSAPILNLDWLREFGSKGEVIFHVHNWFNIFNQSNFEEISREYNLVFTLHDQRLFTGACHYSFGCSNFEESCTNCPQMPRLFRNVPSSVHSNGLRFSEVSYISPSIWLKNLAEKSVLLSQSRGLVIPNSFYGYEAVPRERQIDSATINVGFAAMDPTLWIKGGDIIEKLKIHCSRTQVFNFYSLSEFKNYKDFWNLVDVLFVPSRADNSPNVIHEAKLWGVPVLTSDVGGIPEILDKSFDSSISLDSASTDFIESEIRRIYFISKDFDLKKDIALRHKMRLSASIKMHIDFYKSIA